ncbi:MAG: TRAP transporter small permease [Betaproteobacteria bacterium]
MGVFRRALAALGLAELTLAAAALVAITGLNAAGVVMRYGLNASLVWAEEISLLLMNVMVFLGAAVMYKARAYVVLEYFYRRLPPGPQRGLTLLTWALACAFAALAAGYAVSLYPLQINTTSYILELPRFYATVPLIVGCASIAAASAYYFWQALHGRDAASILPPIELT